MGKDGSIDFYEGDKDRLVDLLKDSVDFKLEKFEFADCMAGGIDWDEFQKQKEELLRPAYEWLDSLSPEEKEYFNLLTSLGGPSGMG